MNIGGTHWYSHDLAWSYRRDLGIPRKGQAWAPLLATNVGKAWKLMSFWEKRLAYAMN